MDKLKTDLYGGFPLELDDIRWALTGIERVFKGFADGLGSGFILAGCETSTAPGPPGFTQVAAGFCVFDGEVYEFLGDTYDDTLVAQIALVPLNMTDPSGIETFEDLTVQNAYERRRAVITIAPVLPVPGVRLSGVDGQRLPDRLWDLLAQMAPTWRVIGDVGQPPYLNGWLGSVGDPPRYRREPGGLCRLAGILLGSAATDDEPFVLPPGFRPATTKYRDLDAAAGVPPTNSKQVWIPSTGAIKLVSLSATFGNYDLSAMAPFEIGN